MMSRYKREFGFVLDKRAIHVDDIRVRGTAKSGVKCQHKIDVATSQPSPVHVSLQLVLFVPDVINIQSKAIEFPVNISTIL